MKKLFILFATALCLCAENKAMAYDFSAVNNDGDTLYYNITSPTPPLTVEVTYEMQYDGFYSGNIIIPDNVINEGNTYSVTSIGENAFSFCDSLTSITIPHSVTTIGEYAFSHCSGLISISIPNSVITIGDYAFAMCSGLTFISIPHSITSIGMGTFTNCSGLTSVTIPNSVTYIGMLAFDECSGLNSVTIGNSVTTIRDGVFSSCTELTEIYVKAKVPPSLSSTVFWNVPDNIPVYVPCGKETDYENALEWNYFTNIIGNVSSLDIALQSNNATMGTVNIIQVNTCTNDTAVIEAIANAGYFFVQWNDGDTSNPRTVTVTQDTIFTAEFEAILHHVTVAVNDANKGSVSGEGDYRENTTATIGATANQNYRFVQWNDANTDNPRTIIVTQDITFTAEFEIMMYHVAVSSNNTNLGSVSGEGDYSANSTAIISATANPDDPNFVFLQWNDGNIENPRTITVTQDTAFIATFSIVIGITDIEISTLTIYPNPATDNISVSLPENVSQAVFTLYDMQGKVLIRQEVSSKEGVAVNNLASGIYMYSVRTDKQNYQGKLIRK
jgi:hypothetical protein